MASGTPTSNSLFLMLASWLPTACPGFWSLAQARPRLLGWERVGVRFPSTRHSLKAQNNLRNLKIILYDTSQKVVILPIYSYEIGECVQI